MSIEHSLPPSVRGYCVMIDIWRFDGAERTSQDGSRFRRSFRAFQRLFRAQDEGNVSKIVGDMLMVWIPICSVAPGGLLWNYKILLEPFAAEIPSVKAQWFSRKRAIHSALNSVGGCLWKGNRLNPSLVGV